VPRHPQTTDTVRLPDELNGGWLNTDGIWWDATKEATGLFEQIAAPAPGGLVVFPGKATSKTLGNFTKTGDAIRETEPTMFKAAATIFARPAGVPRPS
jgi:hypothetical protein